MKKIAILLLSMSILSLVACGGGTSTVHTTLTASNATYSAPAYMAAIAPTETTASAEVEKIVLTITEISAHLADDSTDGTEADDEGWMVLSSTETTVDLMAVASGDAAVLGETELDEGKYTQIRLTVKSGTVTVGGVDSAITLPSGKLKLVSTLTVEADKEYDLVLNFDVAKSVFQTGNGEWKLKPTVKATLNEVE